MAGPTSFDSWLSRIPPSCARGGDGQQPLHEAATVAIIDLPIDCGVELSHVSILLGHSSIKVTERHYAPWAKARQKQLEEDVRRAWATLARSA